MARTQRDVDGKPWTAWHLPAGATAWHPVCQADDAEGCLCLALAVTEGGMVRVLPAGRRPSAIPAAGASRLPSRGKRSVCQRAFAAGLGSCRPLRL